MLAWLPSCCATRYRLVTGRDAGALGVVGLALAVGGLTISSITSSVGGGGGGGGPAGKAAEPVKQLLDRVPQPLPVTKKAEEAVTQVTSKGAKCPGIH